LQFGSSPPTVTVAVTDLWPRLETSTVIFGVPWPLMIFPADSDHSKVGVISGPPDTVASKVTEPFDSAVLGQLTEMVAQGGGSGRKLGHITTATVIEALAVCLCLLLASTVAV
jgi:hypothetical protein